MRFHTVVAAYALWLMSILVAFYLTYGKSEVTMQITLVAGAIPVGLQLFLLGLDWHGLVAPVKMWLTLLLVVLLSYLASNFNALTATRAAEDSPLPAAWIPIVYTVNVIFMALIAIAVAGCPDRRLLRSVAGLFSIICAPFLVYIDLTGERTWGDRLVANGIASNWWGLMGLTVCITAFARRPGPLAFTAFAGGGATILAGSSREDMVAIAACVVIVVISYVRTLTRARLMVVLAGVCAASLMAMILLPYIIDAISYLASDILLVDDPARGMGSGVTGRQHLWLGALEIWLKHPLFGIGFRQNEQFLGGYSAHNAYLAMLADTGLVGFVWFMVLLGTTFRAALGIQDQRTRLLILTFLVANVIIGFFDRRIINGGTPYGIFFVLCFSAALVDESLRKASARFSAAHLARSAGSGEVHAV